MEEGIEKEGECLVCKHEGKESGKLFYHGSMHTLVGFGGHDDNCCTEEYHCSNGHKYSVRRRNTCTCGWKGKEECFCHILGIQVERGKEIEKIPLYLERLIDECVLG